MITTTTDGAAVLADRIRTRARVGYQLDANEVEVVMWALGLVIEGMLDRDDRIGSLPEAHRKQIDAAGVRR